MNVKHFQQGAYAGVAGGVVFGILMAMMGMLPMIGQMVGHPSVITGFLVHLAISALIGASFAGLFHPLIRATRDGLGYGLLYAGVWWVLGPLTLMPLLLGMAVNWNASAVVAMLPSLVGHLVYGGVLGVAYVWLKKPENSTEQATRHSAQTLAELCMYNSVLRNGGLKEKQP